VRLHGKEILLDEVAGFLIFVGLGIQPSTSTSGRSGAEIHQDRTVLVFSRGEGLVNIFAPVDGHKSPPGKKNLCKLKVYQMARC
jgi:hypothetical protein